MPELQCPSPVLLVCPHCSTPIPLSAAHSDDLVVCPACHGKSIAAPFDPYHRWLGIPPEQQPPDHYALLGLNQFEQDPEVIEAAADQRILYLRTHAAKHPRLTQRLLEEVGQARICLLNNTQRVVYDRQFLVPAPPPAPPPVRRKLVTQPEPRLYCRHCQAMTPHVETRKSGISPAMIVLTLGLLLFFHLFFIALGGGGTRYVCTICRR